jgi:glycosyltransferase involved in cell wall biosynthesis
MRVAVVAPSPVPLRSGGAERLWTGLVDHLGQAGHAVELVKLPVREYVLPDLVAGYRQFADLDLSHVDLVISGKYPAWMVDHPNHVVYMLHPLRGLYDRYPEEHLIDATVPRQGSLDRIQAIVAGSGREPHLDELASELDRAVQALGPDHDVFAIPGPLSRSVVQFLDRVALHPRRVRRHLAISHQVAGRVGYFPPGVDVGVVYPPPGLDPGASPLPSLDGRIDLLSVGRLEAVKRHDLVVEAMGHVASPQVRLSIVGEGPERSRLELLSSGDARITVEGALDDPGLAHRYRSAAAVIAVPEGEDLGYVALEAMLAARPVVTCRDTGGIAELVGDDARGRTVEPTAAALGSAIERLVGDPDTMGRLGAAGRAFAEQITWESVVARMLEPTPTASGPRIAMLSTYPVLEGMGGGARRARAMAEALASLAQVDIVSLSVDADRIHEVSLRDRPVTEVVVPRSGRHADAETRLRALSEVPSVTDMAAAVLWPASPQWVREMRASCEGADVIVLAHPYLVEAAKKLAPGVPLVYDAHNDEVGLKDQLLPETEAGDWWRAVVERVETAAVVESVVVAAPTDGERESLGKLAETDDHILVVPNGTDAAGVTFTTGTERAQRTAELLARRDLPADSAGVVLFVGSGHPPNLTGAERVVELASRMTAVQFFVVGRCGEVLDPARVPSNLTITGRVTDDELAQLLAGATAALNPVSEGGGSNLKVIEALAAGVPVVTTSVGARGVPRDLVTVTTVPGLSHGLDQVLSNPEATRERVQRARTWVSESLDWAVVMQQLVETVNESIWP